MRGSERVLSYLQAHSWKERGQHSNPATLIPEVRCRRGRDKLALAESPPFAGTELSYWHPSPHLTTALGGMKSELQTKVHNPSPEKEGKGDVKDAEEADSKAFGNWAQEQ